MLNIIILAGGQPITDVAGGNYPVCLADFNGKPLIERIFERSQSLDPENVSVAFRQNDIERFNMADVARVLLPEVRVISVKGETQGAACTALLACSGVSDRSELIILNATDLIDVDFREVIEDFRSRALDAGAVVFPSVHPRYSYIRLDGTGMAVEAAEKRPISRHASAGFFWYRNAADFIEGAKNMIRKSAHVDGGYFVCPVFNELILKQKRIGVFEIPAQRYHPFKAERHLRDYEVALERSTLDR